MSEPNSSPASSGGTHPQDRLPASPYRFQHFIDGQWRESADGRRLERRSPAHGVVVSDYAFGGSSDIEDAIQSARRAFDTGPWPHTRAEDRARILLATADAIERQLEELAVVEALECGKPIAQARAELSGSAGIWRYAASLARTLHGESYNNLGPDMLGVVVRDPVGVVSIITPWNFPFLIASQKLPFALAAGCTVVLKPSEMTSGTTMMLGAMLQDAGLPDGALNIVIGDGPTIGEPMLTHGAVDMVSFTGSTGVGKRVMAAGAGTLKRTSMELGGKNPQILMPDADLDAAIDACVFGAYFNVGQCCNSGSRLLLHRSIADDVTERLVAHSQSVKVGDPLDDTTQVGAIVSEEHMGRIESYIGSAETAGARTRLGGKRLAIGPGRYLEPTVIDRVDPSTPLAREEVFGPVVAVIAFDTVEDAIAIANDTVYGLSAGVWSRDMDTALKLARGVRAGTVWMNTFMDGYAELPFGGYRQSGLGRELGKHAVEDYTETKTLQMHIGPRTNWWVGKPA